jgi:uncharacterized peroxidase-related enzyme
MSRFPSLPDNTVLGDVFKRFPKGVLPLCEYHDIFLRADSEISVAEREMLAAYVSGLNACNYCHGSHQIIAETHGIDAKIFDKLINDPENSGVDAKFFPLLAYLKKLTETPSKMTDKDAEAVFAVGWSEDALYDAICICAIFNAMNRIIEGTGVISNDMIKAEQRERMTGSEEDPEYYRNYARMLGNTG